MLVVTAFKFLLLSLIIVHILNFVYKKFVIIFLFFCFSVCIIVLWLYLRPSGGGGGGVGVGNTYSSSSWNSYTSFLT